MRRAAVRDERGFAIVGVIMLVLALTILGLSLFSLSSYESQFINHSLDEQRAFDAASRGVERAKFQILRSNRLEQSNWGMPADGVDSVKAWQIVAGTPVYQGNLANDLVYVHAYGRVGTAPAEVEAAFDPVLTVDYYRRLFTVHGPITVGNTTGALRQVRLEGIGWQTNGGTGWTSFVDDQLDSLRYGPVIPVPDVAAFLVAHPNPAVGVITEIHTATGTEYEYTFDASGLPVRFMTISQSGLPGITIATGSTRIHVLGNVVLVIPKGMRFDGYVQIVQDIPNSSLVVVAAPSPGPDYPNLGIHFGNGFTSEVPLVLVTSGTCDLLKSSTDVNTVPYVSIFAPTLYLEGAPTPFGKFVLQHPTNSPNDLPNGLIDRLIQSGALPNALSAANKLTFRPGTWKLTSN